MCNQGDLCMKGLIPNLVITCNRFAKDFIRQTEFGGTLNKLCWHVDKMFGSSVHEEEERADKQKQI